MQFGELDRETVLDLTVNAIPLGILSFFFVAFVVANPFGWNSVASGLQLAIVGSMMVLLGVLSYYAGRAVSRAEADGESEEPPGVVSGSRE
ncbi:cox cluster protein [Halorhabdus tiamatea SARL4B]|uniref:Cox cluster protein n=1 Tax=Halorhabdus tiamatea SARL4B TaxID=1033806 RepID=F7PQY4_9EURY|nr:DUF6684 family protein [Halorhabdus tiamatea]ERJ04599.1 cox cluster protein [Halorhabdus tiamatea SARL4B]CCQ32154.1 conserved hypothetical protein [Halorhabdus tiamatea SARL4B]